MSFDSIVSAILSISSKESQGHRDRILLLDEEANKIKSGEHSLDDFSSFLRSIHDPFICGETALRALILRLIRLSIKDLSYCNIIVEEEVHWLVLMSLEREHEYMLERMQALKLMRVFIALCPLSFPIAFARSLVAVANNKDDNIRRVCLESLRELSVIVPELVVRVNGISCLLDAVIEPNTQDMAEPILMSILYLLNDSETRQAKCIVFFLLFFFILLFCYHF